MKKNFVFLLNLIACFSFIHVLSAYAGTDGAELSSAFDKMLGLITGTGGRIIVLTGAAFALITSMIKFNVVGLISSLGIGIAIGVLGPVINATVTVLLP